MGAAQVVHVQYDYDVLLPYRGVSPLQRAADSGRLSAETVAALADESAGPRGSVLPMPASPETNVDDDPMGAIRRAIASAAGRLLTVEAQPDVVDPGRGARLYEPQRFGSDPPEGLVKLHGQASAEIAGAFGVPASLLFASANAQAGREAWRQLWRGCIAPIGRLVEAELRDKPADPGLTLDWSELGAADVAGRANAYAKLRAAGMDDTDARAAAGI